VEQPVPADAGAAVSLSAGGAPNRLTLPIAAGPLAEEAEPNDAPGAAQEVPLPLALQGAFEKRGDVDAFRFTLRAKETVRIEVEARERDSLADPRFKLLDAAGKTLLEVDDADRSRDPAAVWTAPADGSYTLVVQDLAGGSRGGPGSYYRVSIGPAEPQLSLAAAQPTLLVKPGAKAEWSFTLFQSYQPEEVTLTVEGLPPGVTAEPVKVAALPRRNGSTPVKVVLTAAPDAKPGFAPVRVIATTGGATPRTAPAAWMLTGDGGVSLGVPGTSRLLALVPAP
jgi:hypothetical protein